MFCPEDGTPITKYTEESKGILRYDPCSKCKITWEYNGWTGDYTCIDDPSTGRLVEDIGHPSPTSSPLSS